MSRFRNILLSLVLTFWTTALYAGDEDMSPSAYHVFDPETGYMVTVDPTDEEQQVSTLPGADAPELEPTGRVAPQFWIVAMIITIGIAVWVQMKRASHK